MGGATRYAAALLFLAVLLLGHYGVVVGFASSLSYKPVGGSVFVSLAKGEGGVYALSGEGAVHLVSEEGLAGVYCVLEGLGGLGSWYGVWFRVVGGFVYVYGVNVSGDRVWGFVGAWRHGSGGSCGRVFWKVFDFRVLGNGSFSGDVILFAIGGPGYLGLVEGSARWINISVYVFRDGRFVLERVYDARVAYGLYEYLGSLVGPVYVNGSVYVYDVVLGERLFEIVFMRPLVLFTRPLVQLALFNDSWRVVVFAVRDDRVEYYVGEPKSMVFHEFGIAYSDPGLCFTVLATRDGSTVVFRDGFILNVSGVRFGVTPSYYYVYPWVSVGVMDCDLEEHRVLVRLVSGGEARVVDYGVGGGRVVFRESYGGPGWFEGFRAVYAPWGGYVVLSGGRVYLVGGEGGVAGVVDEGGGGGGAGWVSWLGVAGAGVVGGVVGFAVWRRWRRGAGS